MFLNHHTIPFATGNIGVVGSTEQRVATETLCHTIGPHVGIRATRLSQTVVHGLCIVHIVEVGHGLHREEHQLAIEITCIGRNLFIESQST